MCDLPDPSSGRSSEDEFVDLLTGVQSNLHAFLTSLLYGDHCVDDVLQQTNLVLWKKRTSFELGSNFRAWAFSVARWEVKAWLTRRKRADWLSFHDDLSALLAARFDHSTLVGSENGALDALSHCLGKLKKKDRLLVLTHYQDDKAISECARIYQRGADSLKVSLFRIRRLLRRCVDSQLSIERSRS